MTRALKKLSLFRQASCNILITVEFVMFGLVDLEHVSLNKFTQHIIH